MNRRESGSRGSADLALERRGDEDALVEELR
jgi:hypothetical protein